MSELDDQALLRYSRHILLPEFGIEGQERLAQSHALLIGAGGLGSPVALYLAAAGIGHLTIVDNDQVDLTNLQRQIIHTTSRIGQAKVHSAQIALMAINPLCTVTPLLQRVDAKALAQLVPQADIVIDASDNFSTRHAINRACVASKKPLVSGAATRFDGQISVFDLRCPDSPCYHCLFPEEGDISDGPCATFGVFAPLVGIIGSMEAAEAIKLCTALGQPLVGKLLLLEAQTMQWRQMRFTRDPACPVCGKR